MHLLATIQWPNSYGEWQHLMRHNIHGKNRQQHGKDDQSHHTTDGQNQQGLQNSCDQFGCFIDVRLIIFGNVPQRFLQGSRTLPPP